MYRALAVVWVAAFSFGVAALASQDVAHEERQAAWVTTVVAAAAGVVLALVVRRRDEAVSRSGEVGAFGPVMLGALVIGSVIGWVADALLAPSFPMVLCGGFGGLFLGVGLAYRRPAP